jgi:hypothetical protein
VSTVVLHDQPPKRVTQGIPGRCAGWRSCSGSVPIPPGCGSGSQAPAPDADNGLTAQDPPPMRLANGTGPKAISPIALGPFARSHGGRLPQAPWRRAQLEGGSNRDGQ